MLKKSLKNFFLALTAAASLLGASTIYAKPINMTLVYDGKSHAYTAEEVKIKLNGKEITNMEVPPVIINDRTMVPARVVFEELGAEVAWNAETKEVYIIRGTDLVVLKIDSNTGYTNGLEFKMDTPAKIVNDRTMIPVRAASEALGCTVGWNDASRLVTINDANYKEPQPEKPPVTPTVPDLGAAINVTGITVPQSKTSEQTFTINAGGAIEKYETFMLEDNRIVVDIYNANNFVPTSSITNTNSTIVSAVRSGQNQTEPNKITRIVLDITANAKYSVKLSEDKKNIAINFDLNVINDLSVAQKDSSDRITIHGALKPAIKVSTLTGPDRLVIDIPNSRSELKESYAAELNHIKTIHTSSQEQGITRIVLELNKYINYTVEEGTNSVTVVVEKSTLDNMVYDSENKTLVLKNIDGLRESDFSIVDNYLIGTYVMTLPGNYKNTYGYGTISAGDSMVSSIEIKNNSNSKTQIIVNTNAIISTKFYDNNNEIRIKFVNPKEIYDKIVVIDAGHGKTDPGTSGNGLVEKDVNLDVMMRVCKLFEADGRIKVYATRVDDSYPTNVKRAQMANEIADLFISIHQNAAANNPAPSGTEVLYKVHATDVDGRLTSKIAAQFMQNYIVSSIGTTDRGIKNRPDLIVLNQTNVPAVLIETAFLSNPSDAELMKNDAVKDKLANAIYSATVDMMNQHKIR